jgi:glycosyltransferase involved in cell wall biosynthesis
VAAQGNDPEYRLKVARRRVAMKVLNVGSGDIVGGRFNGYSASKFLDAENIESRHLVWNAKSKAPNVQAMFDIPGSRLATRALGLVERRLSIHSMLQLQSFALPAHKAFRDADVVHYQIIHDGFFSILALPWLTRLKPSVWTWHDPWFMTGHCIYPLGCERWQIGCGSCPALDLPFPFRHDRTAFAFRQKKWLRSHTDVDIIVASKHMRSMVERSPIAQGARVHCLPFGVDLNRFCPREATSARKRLGIFDGRVVLCVRAAIENPFKGLSILIDALERVPKSLKLSIITTHSRGCMNRFIGRHQLIELGWVDDEDVLLDAYAAADIFIMPSTEEAFGMMAIEAMACGRPVIVCDRTALPETAFAPTAGLSVPNGDAGALAAAILRLATNPDERRARGLKSRQLAEQHYDIRHHARRLAEIYRSAKARRASECSAETRVNENPVAH